METLAITTDNATQLELKQAGALFLTAANELVIEDDAKYATVTDGIKAIKATSKQVEEAFKKDIEEANAEHKRLTTLRGSYLKPLEEAERIIKRKMGEYVAAKERIQEEKQRKQREAERAERDRLAAEAKALEASGDLFAALEKQEEAETMVAVKVEVAAPKVEGISYTTDWEVTITDAAMVPVQMAGYTLRPVDEPAVKRMVKATKGEIKVPGVSIKEIKSARVGR